jgi:hypothetical protein
MIPDFLYLNTRFSLLKRILYVFQLIYLRLFVDFKSYDVVIFSSYDEIALSIVPFNRKLFLINHDNARGLDNNFKAWCLKKISNKHNHIVFNEYMSNKFKEHGIDNVYTVSHGCTTPIDFSVLENSYELNNLSNKLLSDKYRYIIFSPSSAVDNTFFKEVLEYPEFLNFLSTEKILFVFRNNSFQIDNENLLVLNEHLSKNQYELLFLKSEIILINYPKLFKYRVSGVFFECCANYKKVLIRKNQAFENYYSFFNYDPSYVSPSELIEKIKLILNKDDFKFIVDRKSLTPNFTDILNS